MVSSERKTGMPIDEPKVGPEGTHTSIAGSELPVEAPKSPKKKIPGLPGVTGFSAAIMLFVLFYGGFHGQDACGEDGG